MNQKKIIMKTRNIIFSLIAWFTTSAILISCDSDVKSSGTAGLKITDAAVDAENVSGVFLSVSEVKASGNTENQTVVVYDEPRLFNLMDYQNGATYDLGSGELKAGIYSEIRLITDGDSYVEFNDGSTEPLTIPSAMSSGYKIKGDYQISANSRTDLVIDVDLRKAFVKTGENTFILRPTARLINDVETSTITGTVSANNEDRIVIYAYAEGTYSDSESDMPAEGETRFENSINSAVVSNGEFTLAFMEPGDYDLIAVAYSENASSETYEFKSASEAEVLINGSILNVLELEAETDIEVVLNINF